MTTLGGDTRVHHCVDGVLRRGQDDPGNRILTENHGKRIAVVENEYNEVSIDKDLW
ncbi:MAG: hypothetical protein CM1200mP22_07420 [Dehalococcoidia bacterium]|nr:MAG: hypothetical protein CM1200mP22_07420 [Dehalococcoidia bacterium]